MSRGGLKLSLLMALSVLYLMGSISCQRNGSPTSPFHSILGGYGLQSGRFNRPRGIVYHSDEACLFVVDWSGRIQKLTLEGHVRASWIMPLIEKGKAEDLCVGRDGNLFVADTHYSRIVEYTPKGEWVNCFGRYGMGPGEFVYPVGLCRDAQGHLYVSEYGEVDRIQVFEEDGTFLYTWGETGTEDGQFQRPGGMDISKDGELFVADSVNHRVQVFTLKGEWRRTLGEEGRGPGQFRYPYDVAVRGKDLFVIEYGNHRIQKMTLQGEFLAMRGGPGSEDGQFASPWRCCVAQGMLFVSDTDNHRVVGMGETF